MIEINLIPPHLRKSKKNNFLLGKFNIPLEVVIGAGGGLIFLLILVHIGLLYLNMQKLAEHKSLQKEWAEVLPFKNHTDSIIQNMKDLQKEHKDIEGILMSDSRISWSKKLNVLSDSVPRGVWFRKISVTEDMFFIEGSAISKQNKEMINVHRFTSNLRKHDEFFDHLSELELGSMQRRKIDRTEIADFLVKIKLK